MTWAKLDRAGLLRRILGLAALAGLLCSPKLWLASGRLYPLTPVFGGLPQLPYPLDYALFGAALAALAGVVVWPRPRPFVKVFLVSVALLMLFDQSRWQPWLIQYAVMLASLASAGEGQDRVLHPCRFYLILMYFWAGLQKLNYGFVVLLGLMLRPMFERVGLNLEWLQPGTLAPLGVFLAAVECASGVLLAVPRLRRIGAACLLMMHATLLLWLGPLGLRWNYTIWPWNLAMMALLVLLFLDGGRWNLASLWRSRAYARALGVVLGAAPILTTIGVLDSYLGFALYSGNAREAVVFIDPKRIGDLPQPVRGLVNPNGTLDVNRWAESEIGVPVYPESRIYRSVGRQVALWLPGGVVRVIELDRPNWVTGRRQGTTYDPLTR